MDAAWAALTEGGEEEGQPEGAAAASVAAPAAAAAAATDGDATTTSSSTRVAVHQYASAAALALPATATVALDPERLRSAEQAVALSPQARRELRQVFARGQDGAHDGLTPGFLEGVKHQRLVRGRAPRHRGLYVGAVTRVTPRGGIYVQLEVPLKRGDGLVFDAGRPESQEEGGSVYNVLDGRGRPLGRAYDDGGGGSGRGAAPAAAATGRRARGGAAAGSGPDADGSPGGGATAGGSTVAAGQEVQLVFGPGQVDPSRVRPGQLVWMTKDHALEAKIRSSYENLSSAELRKVPVRVAVSGAVGRPLTLTLRDAAGNEASGSTAVPLSSARQRPLTAEDVLRAIGELGDNVLTVPDGGVDLSALDLAQGERTLRGRKCLGLKCRVQPACSRLPVIVLVDGAA